MRKQLAILGVGAAGLVGGGAAGMALTGTSVVAGAQSGTTTTVPARSADDRPDPSARLQEILKPLVDDGTLTQAQADTVVDTLKSAGPVGDHGGPGGPGRDGRGGPGLDAAATALGMTADELRTELQSGKTIAAVAEEQGVDVSKVTAALLDDEKEHLAADVSSGRITQAQADRRLAGAEQRIQERVTSNPPKGGPGGRGHDGPPNRDDQSPAPAPSVGDAPTTTAG